MNLTTPYLGTAQAIPAIVPFSYRSGATLMEIIKALEKWIKKDLLEWIDAGDLAHEAYVDGVLAEMQTLIDQYHSEIIAAKNDWDVKYQEIMDNLIGMITELNELAVNGITKTYRENKLGIYNVQDYGGVGNGIADDLVAVEAVLAAAPEGSTVLFPMDHYRTTSKLRNADGTGWTKITKSLTMLGGTKTKMENFAFWVQGAASPLAAFAVSAAPGDDTIHLSGANVKHNDVIQIFTAFDAYTTDAGIYQMGSDNPTTGGHFLTRAGQVVRVADSVGNQVELAGRTLYNYNDNIAGLLRPLPGVGNSEWRKLTPVKDFTVKNIEFIHNDSGSSKGWNIRLTENFTFDNCKISVGLKAGGSTLVVTDSIGFKMTECIVTHAFTTNTNNGSGDNLILIGAGCSQVRITGNTFTRGAQIVDVITNDIPQNPGSQNELTKSQLRSCDDIVVDGNTFINNVMGFTVHPACNFLTFQNNVVRGSGIGLQSRGLNAVIQGNDIETYLTGVGVSSFAKGTVIRDNKLRQFDAPVDAPHGWRGVSMNGAGDETITDNMMNVKVIGNYIEARTHIGYSSIGVFISHTSATIVGAPNAVKFAQSDVDVSNNEMVNCGIRVGEYWAGVRIINNKIRITPGDPTIVPVNIRLDYNAAGCTIVGNTLTNSTVGQIQTLGMANSELRPFNVQHQISANTIIGVINLSLFQPFRESKMGGRVTYVESVAGLDGPHVIDELKTINVVFPEKFIMIPRLMVAPNVHGQYSVVAIDITLTGFTLQLKFASNFNYKAGAFYTVSGYQG